MKVAFFRTAALMLLGATALASAQESPAVLTPLSALIAESEAKNPQIAAANHAWKAAAEVPKQVTTLPDPRVTVQQFSVGSPKPFAGYTNSDFAYIGIGASQELPYPGKLRLRGQVAEAEAGSQLAAIAVTSTTIIDALKSDYLQLAYLQQTLTILRENEKVLGLLIQDAISHYQVGQGMQQEVLQAQVERTKLVREITMHHQQMGMVEAHLKQLLDRDQGSPDIEAEGLKETQMRLGSAELLSLVRQNNPGVKANQSALAKQEMQVASAKREGKPDFDVSYMYQNTDRKYRDYYMFTLNIRLPKKGRVDAQVAEAIQMQAQAKSALDAQLQQQLAAAQQQYVQAASDNELLTEYRDGLIPQSEAAYRASLSAYATNKEQFVHVLEYFNGLLNLRLELAKTVADHEIALSHLESLTGASLR